MEEERVGGVCIWNFWLDRTPESRRKKKKKKTGREKAFSRTLLLVADVWTGSVQYDETRQHGAGQFRLTSYGRCSTLLVYSRILHPLYISSHRVAWLSSNTIYSSTPSFFSFLLASRHGIYIYATTKRSWNYAPTFTQLFIIVSTRRFRLKNDV